MAKHLTQLRINPMSSAEACNAVLLFGGTSDGALQPGISLHPHLDTLPITWTLRVTNQHPHFAALVTMHANNPRVTVS